MSLEKEAFLGKIEGRRARGRQNQICCKPCGGHPGRDDGDLACEAGAGSKWVAFHGRPRQSRHGTLVSKVRYFIIELQ